MSQARLGIGRDQIVAHRRRVNDLDERLPPGRDSLRRAAWAGLTDSMPRAALLSIHARVAATGPTSWEDASLAQIWGPRFSAYVVAEIDAPVFTLGRLPDDASGLARAERVADRLTAFLGDRRMDYAAAGRGMGMNPNALRYAAPTGIVRIRWEGARRPQIWLVPRPSIDPLEARKELARRYLHVFGPAIAESFSDWAGIKLPRARAAFEALTSELVPVRTPIGDAWLLASDEAALRSARSQPASARLLPSGDAFSLLWGADRALLVPDELRRRELWTSRVWPGAVLVGGEIVGTWRRADADVDVSMWRALSTAERDAIVAEAEGLPLPGLAGPIRVRWTG